MNNTEKGSKAYLFSIVLVAVLGGLLFGYDTAVISGAEKGLQAFFMGASDFTYTDAWHGITSSSALIGCIIGSAISGFFASRFGRKNSLFMAGIMFFLSALGSYWPEFLFFDYGKPTYSLLIAFNFYRVLGGVGVGLASAICPMYIAEHCSKQHPRYIGFMEPVCNHIRSVGGIFRQFPYSWRQYKSCNQGSRRC